MKFSLSNQAPKDIETPCLVIGFIDEAPLGGAAAEIDQASGGRITRGIESGDLDSSRGSITLLHGLELSLIHI